MEKIIKIQKKYLVFREEVKKIEKIFNQTLKDSRPKEFIYLDFNEVSFISRSFTDELLNLLAWYKARQINIKIINLKPNLKKIIELLKKTKEKTKRELTAA